MVSQVKVRLHYNVSALCGTAGWGALLYCVVKLVRICLHYNMYCVVSLVKNVKLPTSDELFSLQVLVAGVKGMRVP